MKRSLRYRWGIAALFILSIPFVSFASDIDTVKALAEAEWGSPGVITQFNKVECPGGYYLMFQMEFAGCNEVEVVVGCCKQKEGGPIEAPRMYQMGSKAIY